MEGSIPWQLRAMDTFTPGMRWLGILLIERGLGEHGQLGIPNATTNQLVPVLVPSLASSKAIVVVSGWWHSMAITMASNKENEEKDDLIGDGKEKEGKGKGKDGDGAEADKNGKDDMFSLAKSTTAMVADREFEQVRMGLGYIFTYH